MFDTFPLWPARASTTAGSVDALFIFLVALSALMSVAIFTMIVVFAIRYRRRRGVAAEQIEGSTPLEITWSHYSAVYFHRDLRLGRGDLLQGAHAPRGATEIYVVAKQWMWKLQHEEGQREINELHVPLGRDVKMILTSQDVIHSFYVPAFRIKQDVLPGRYTTAWFHPTKAGTYHLFCAEYCGIAALGHDWPGRGAGAGAVSGLAQRRRRGGIDGFERAEYFSAAGLLHLPPLGYAGPRSESRRAVWQAGATGRRARGHRR